MSETLPVSLGCVPRILTPTGFLHEVRVPGRAEARDTPASFSTLLTGMGSGSRGGAGRILQEGPIWAGVPTCAASGGFTCIRTSPRRGQNWDLSQDVSTLTTSGTVTGSLHETTAVQTGSTLLGTNVHK